jgi:hypothetical protein
MAAWETESRSWGATAAERANQTLTRLITAQRGLIGAAVLA